MRKKNGGNRRNWRAKKYAQRRRRRRARTGRAPYRTRALPPRTARIPALPPPATRHSIYFLAALRLRLPHCAFFHALRTTLFLRCLTWYALRARHTALREMASPSACMVINRAARACPTFTKKSACRHRYFLSSHHYLPAATPAEGCPHYSPACGRKMFAPLPRLPYAVHAPATTFHDTTHRVAYACLPTFCPQQTAAHGDCERTKGAPARTAARARA